jgi:hypothetical protein
MARRRGRLSLGLLARVTACAFGVACGTFGSSDASNGMPEAGSEASLADGPSTADAGDGGTLPDAPSCPTVLDEHFDSPTFAGWTNDVAGMLTQDTMVFRAGSPSLRAVANVSAGTSTHANLTREYNIGPSGIGQATLSFSMRVEPAIGGKVYSELGCGLKLRGGGSPETLVLIAQYSNADLVTLVSNPDGGAAQNRTYLFEPGLPGWYDVKIAVSSTASGPALVNMVVANDAGTMKSASSQAVLPPGFDTLLVFCGINYSDMEVDSGTASVGVHVDDVLLTRCAPP